MKNKLVILILAFLLVPSLLVLAGCSSGGDSQTSTSPTSARSTNKTSVTIPSTQTQSSSSGLNWNDMPVYSGASEMQKGNWAIPASQDADYTKFEWRYYQTSASMTDAAAFYKSQMPSSGWTQTGWMDVQGMSWGLYNKNNENDAAMVWISTQDNKTVIAMWRGTK